MINLSSADDLDGTAETPIGGPQYYPACVQLNVKAKDGVDPIWAPETPARSMYSTGDAIVNIYTPGPDGIENFDIPGVYIYYKGINAEYVARPSCRKHR